MNTQNAFVSALLDPAQPAPSGLTTWNGSDPEARFAVYRNNVIVSLVDALADTFPVTQQLVGDEFFRAMARVYAIEELPQSPILARYGESFPAFIERFPPATTVPYLPDVARLEIARVQSYHAADASPLPVTAFAQALKDEDALPQMKIGLHPSLRLVQSPYAIVSLWAAHNGIAEISTIDPYQPENALIIRPQLSVEISYLPPDSHQFVARLLRGANLGEAVEETSHRHAEFDVADTLGMLVRANAITSMANNEEILL